MIKGNVKQVKQVDILLIVNPWGQKTSPESSDNVDHVWWNREEWLILEIVVKQYRDKSSLTVCKILKRVKTQSSAYISVKQERTLISLHTDKWGQLKN